MILLLVLAAVIGAVYGFLKAVAYGVASVLEALADLVRGRRDPIG